MSRAVFAFLVLVAGVQCFRVPPPINHGAHSIVVDHRPPAQWARPRGPRVQLDEGDRNYISHEVSDPDVGKKGITALKDPELGACFLYTYMKPLIIPRVQRHFYTRTKTATILLTPKDKNHFRQSVGPAVNNLCNTVRSYWLDDNMFFMYMTNQLRSRNAPPPPESDSVDDELSPALVFPTPPPLHEIHVVRTPPPLTHNDHEIKAPPALDKTTDNHDVKAPPPLEKIDSHGPPPSAHRIRIPPPPVKAPPPPGNQ